MTKSFPGTGFQLLSDILHEFGKHLRALRQARSVSQERLADDAGLHRTYVSSVERGERNISLVNIERLAVALGISVREMVPPRESPRRGKR